MQGFSRITNLLINQGCSIISRDNFYRTPLHKAALHGAHDLVKILLAHEAEVNAVDLSLNSPLHYAAMKGSKMTISVLLEYKAFIEIYNRQGFTPIHYLIQYGHIDCLDFLLQSTTSSTLSPYHETKTSGDILIHIAAQYDQISCIPNLMERNGKTLFDSLYHTNHKGRTALHMACKYGNVKFVKELIRLGCDMEAQDQQGKTPLWLTASHGHLDCLCYLIENASANIHCTSQDGIGILLISFQKNHFSCFSYLLKQAEINFLQRTTIGFTLLHLAAKQNKLEYLSILSSYISPNERDIHGNTPLHIAAEYNHSLFVKNLLEIMDRKEVFNHFEQTPLHRAAYFAADDALSMLLHAGYDSNSIDMYGHTPLHLASANGTIHSLELLLKFNSDMNAKTMLGNTMLHFCSRNGNLSCIPLISKYQNDLLIKNKKNNNALHEAAKFYRESCIYKLLELNLSVNDVGHHGFLPLHYAAKNGKTPSVLIEKSKFNNIMDEKDHFGNTPLHIAALHRNMDFCETLVKQNANPQAKNLLGWQPIHMASSVGHHPLISYFVSQKCNVNAVTDEEDLNQTALHIACKKQQIDSVRCLLNVSASPSLPDKQKNTPLHLAAKLGDIEILKLLLLSRHAKDAWNILDNDGKMPIHYTLKNNDDVSSRLLLKEDDEYGVEIWMRPQSTALTCIHIAALIGDVSAISHLIEILPKDKIIAIDDRNRTPLDIAKTTNHPECVEILETFFNKDSD